MELKEKYTIDDLLAIMKRLRDPDGCPWDKVQTHESLRQSMIEEAYEAVDAIDKNDMASLCEELGDVLLQVAFHCQIETENKNFTFNDICDDHIDIGSPTLMIECYFHLFERRCKFFAFE